MHGGVTIDSKWKRRPVACAARVGGVFISCDVDVAAGEAGTTTAAAAAVAFFLLRFRRRRKFPFSNMSSQ